MKTTRIQEVACPACGKPIDAATSLDDHTPKPGDLTVCIDCTSFLTFTESMTLRCLTLQEVGDLPDDWRMALMDLRRKFEHFNKHVKPRMIAAAKRKEAQQHGGNT